MSRAALLMGRTAQSALKISAQLVKQDNNMTEQQAHTLTHVPTHRPAIAHTHMLSVPTLQGTATCLLGCCAAAVDGNNWCTMHPRRYAIRQAL
jgi:hypothetical protein